MKRYSLIFSLFAVAAFPCSAFATGGLGCTIKDENLLFSYEALFSYEDWTRLFQDKLDLKASHKGLPPSLSSLNRKTAQISQQWISRKSINLEFSANSTEPDAKFTKLTLSIETKALEDEISYEGTYLLELQGAPVDGVTEAPLTLEGKVECAAG